MPPNRQRPKRSLTIRPVPNFSQSLGKHGGKPRTPRIVYKPDIEQVRNVYLGKCRKLTARGRLPKCVGCSFRPHAGDPMTERPDHPFTSVERVDFKKLCDKSFSVFERSLGSVQQMVTNANAREPQPLASVNL